jgi:L-serine dehydratase
MTHFGLFDILGPVMIGPSSSHTAGAARIGYIARRLFERQPTRATLTLHGSFAKTYQGHGTDKALIGGLLGFMPDDPRIRDAEAHAKDLGFSYEFESGDLGEVHPNTVKILLSDDDGQLEIVGSSIGGGRVNIIRINTTDVLFTGDYATLITKHEDRPGMVARITTLIAEYQINIATLSVFRNDRGKRARLILESDEPMPPSVLEALADLEHVVEVKYLPKMEL